MKLPDKERISSVGVVVALAAVLIILAIMQFRWSKEISEAALVRMHADLQTSIMSFRQDFNRELATECLELQPAGTLNSAEQLTQYAKQIEGWRRAASHPELVANIYVSTSGASSQLLQLNPHTNEFQKSEWPLNFEQLHGILQQRSADIAGFAKIAQHSAPPPNLSFAAAGKGRRNAGADHFSQWAVAQTIPALVHPLLERTLANAGPGNGVNPGTRSVSTPAATPGWVILQLNSDVLQGHLLPELAERYFRGPEGFAYRVAVLAGDENGRLVYSSDADFGKDNIQSADSAVNLVGPPSIGPFPDRGYLPNFFSGPRRSGTLGGERRFPDHGAAALPRIDPLRVGADYGGWRLVVQHRNGSMEAAVSSLWRRNLIISLGVLLVLAATTGMMVISAHRAQRLAKLQMDFVTGVSHELRTPLAVISSAAENIADGVVDNKQQMVRYGNVIKTQCRQLMSLVEQILLFAATKEKRYRYDVRLLEVREILDAALAATSGLINTSGFAVEKDIEPGLPKVKGDLAALSQALQNLITNAVKYGERSRWVGIWARTAETEVQEVQIVVEDRGSGIPKAELQHIFEPFYRSASATASQIHGTGLGLPLAKNIAEAMGGALTATSEPGRGSAFILHLPAAGSTSAADDFPSDQIEVEARVSQSIT